MSGYENLALGLILFVGGHFLLSFGPIRATLVEKLGESMFRGAYSVAVAGALYLVIVGYGEAPYDIVIDHPGFLMVPHMLMPLATILLVCSIGPNNFTMAGGEGALDQPDPVRGIATITRHPFLVGACLWAISHMAANPDRASWMLFGGMLLLCIGGMAHIDHKKQMQHREKWGVIAMSSSALPFWAAIQGRTKIDWKGIGIVKPIVGFVVYMGLAQLHIYFAGVSAFPSLSH